MIIKSVFNVKSFKRLQKYAQGSEQNKNQETKDGLDWIERKAASNSEIEIKTWIKEKDSNRSWMKYRGKWNQDWKWTELCTRGGHLPMPSGRNWRSFTLYPKRSFTNAKRKPFKVIYQCQAEELKVIYSVPAKVIHSCQAEDIQGHSPMPSGRHSRSFTNAKRKKLKVIYSVPAKVIHCLLYTSPSPRDGW